MLFAGAALPLVLPLFAVISLLIRVTSRGPIFFKQKRVGLQGRHFKVYKFRTMVNRAEELGTSVTSKTDPRITRFGRTLRATKLDELPQLINVIMGDMSFVGPRPDVPEIVRNYTRNMKRILEIRPGITSVATLHLRDEEAILACVEEPDKFYDKVLVPLKVRLAMEHVERNSFFFDLKIFCQTAWMLTLGRLWPIAEHPAVSDMKRRISMEAKNYSPGRPKADGNFA